MTTPSESDQLFHAATNRIMAFKAGKGLGYTVCGERATPWAKKLVAAGLLKQAEMGWGHANNYQNPSLTPEGFERLSELRPGWEQERREFFTKEREARRTREIERR